MLPTPWVSLAPLTVVRSFAHRRSSLGQTRRAIHCERVRPANARSTLKGSALAAGCLAVARGPRSGLASDALNNIDLCGRIHADFRYVVRRLQHTRYDCALRVARRAPPSCQIGHRISHDPAVPLLWDWTMGPPFIPYMTCLR